MFGIRAKSSFIQGRSVQIAIAVILTGACSVLALLVTAILYTYTGLSESSLGIWIGVITYASIILAGVLAGRGAQRHGWMSGGTAGALYFVGVRVIGWVIVGQSKISSLINAMLIGALVGAIGGILGINLNRKKRR